MMNVVRSRQTPPAPLRWADASNGAVERPLGGFGEPMRQRSAGRELTQALRRTVAMVLAGGQGERLSPLTLHRAKPAVPFGGNYRIIDFTLSNCLNSGIRRVHVLTQYKILGGDHV